jgi:hypothetical protein
MAGMSRRRILGSLLLVAGGCAFVLIARSISWMVYGGVRDYLQLAGLMVSIAVAVRGGWMLVGVGPRSALRDRS